MFKLLFVVLLFVASLCVASPVSLQASKASQAFNSTTGITLFYSFASHDGTIVARGFDPDALYAYWIVFNEKDGQFVTAAKVNSSGMAGALDIAVNNGKWMGGIVGGGIGGYEIQLFKLDANNNPINQTSFQIPYTSSSMALLSDNTLVLVDFQTPNATVRSFLFDMNNLTWVEGPSLDVLEFQNANAPFNSVWIDDKQLILLNTTFYTFIYTRQQNGSWVQTDGFQFDMSLSSGNQFNLYSNGIDTVIFAYPVSAFQGRPDSGFVVVYTKVNNAWESQVITNQQMGLQSSTFVGFRTFAKVDNNNLLLGVPTQQGFIKGPGIKRAFGLRPPLGPLTGPTGAAVLLQRQHDEWVVAASITSSDNGTLGTAVGVSNNNIIVTLATSTPWSFFEYQFYTVPLCVTRPMNVTCQDQQLSKCQLDADTSNAYKADQCSSLQVSASVKSLNFVDYSLQVSFEFDRPLSPTYTCNVTLSCAHPPITVPTGGKQVSAALTLGAFTALMLLGLFALF